MNNELMKWDLQIFAEDEGDSGQQNGSNAEDVNNGDNGDNNQQGDEKKYTDKDVDDIVGKKFQKLKSKHEKELKTAREEAEKLAKMNAEQKKDYELEKAQARIKELELAQTRTELGKEAAKIFKENKIEATQDMLDFVVSDSAEKTKENIEKFVKIINSQIKLAEIERSKGKTPPSFNSGSGSLKKDDILKISDSIERQKAIAENINLFN